MEHVIIIGSGNVAEALTKALAESPIYELTQIVARNEERGRQLADMAGCGFTSDWAETDRADIYIIAVADRAIAEASGRIDFGDGVVAHTAGGLNVNVLDQKIEHRAVLYPLQTFSAGREVDLSQVPLFVEGSTQRATDTVTALAQRLSRNVRYASSAQRAHAHLAAVFASNFTNYMYIVAEQVLANSGMEFELLAPLIEECAAKAVACGSPRLSQTGPAMRGDIVTQNNHRAMLSDARLREIYITLSENIWQTLRKR
ncbi:MAG: DUF2520 domain-containing protein [Rikenellaceae bacterium]|jgi:predicted short-subunit dehydrogenase-like oxidoreductase (DUF2520 family)|nr:DUF2520 domain-containing protein [Rikenellaceae bacterium]